MTTSPITLITGTMGCLGAWAAAQLVRRGETVISFDLSQDRSRLNLLLSPDEQEATIHFITGDLTDFAQVQRAVADYGATRIIHLAALQVPFCRANPVMGSAVNVTGTVNLFEAAKQAGIKHLTYASSIAVYGPPSDYPPGLVAHDATHAPRTLYGVYKVANEGTARIYWQDHGISSTALRPHTVYGLGRDQGLTSDPTKAMLAAAAGVPSSIKFGGTVQMQHASDVAAQFIDASATPVQGAFVYNLGTPPVSVDDIIAHIQAAKPGAHLTRTDNRLPFPEGFDDSALRATVSTVYETPLADGIADTIRSFERLLNEGRIAAPTPA